MLATKPHIGFEIAHKIEQNIQQVVQGQSTAIRLLIAATASGGHVLLEDVPGTGKTTLVKTLARSITLDFQRIQFTPDLLPSDILGVSVFAPDTQRFHFHQGPVFTDVLLADEINRASPRTQSALLEAMEERQVSLDRRVHTLNEFFTVIATQNPIEFHGTYPLPEAQMDRFALRFALGYVSAEREVEILSRHVEQTPVDSLTACATAEDLQKLRSATRAVRVSTEIKRYIVELVRATRNSEGIQLGAGLRGAIALLQTSQALALMDGFDFVSPEHVQTIAVPALAHRLSLNPQARFAGHTQNDLVQQIVERVPVPI
jgi:MoxR-like ATPase